AGLLGCGAQGRMQLLALSHVRPLRKAVVWDKFPDAAQALVAWAADRLPFEVEIASTAEKVVDAADIVTPTTPGASPVVRAGWRRPGQHVNAIGSDTVGKQELETGAMRGAKIVVDNLEQCRQLGETQHLPRE